MTHAYGYRRRTRYRFSQPFKHHGAIHMKNYLTKFKRGEFVDVIGDSSNHKSLPYKIYHGRTGRIFNVNPRAVGVILHRQVKGKMVEKRIHVRNEHVKKSRCQEDFLNRIKQNDQKKHEAKKNGVRISTKRTTKGPKDARKVDIAKVEYQNPEIFYEIF